jgi:hypothetical protein
VHENHLRPDEIELLLDGEEGFGVAPLRAHVRQCPACAAELEQARVFLATLDELPDFAPSTGFADRVMRQVQVFEPWHAALGRSVERFVPASRPAKVAAGAGVAVGAGLGTAGLAWALARADVALFLAAIGLERVQERVGSAIESVATAILGQPGLELLRGGSPEMAAVAVGGFVAVVGLGVVGLRTLATASSRPD